MFELYSYFCGFAVCIDQRRLHNLKNINEKMNLADVSEIIGPVVENRVRDSVDHKCV